MTAPLRALTLRHPWPWYVAHGPKRIENRTWKPPANLHRQYLAIHAGKAWEPAEILDAVDWVKSMYERGIEPMEITPGKVADMPRSAIVCVVRIDGFVTASADPWFVGPIGWQLSDVVTLGEPVPCRGAQGLWEVPADVATIVRARWKLARAVATAAGDSGRGYGGVR